MPYIRKTKQRRSIKGKSVKIPCLLRGFLKDILKKLFSIYIRIRNADENGYVKCFTCGKPIFWLYGDCGHYERSNKMPTKYDEQNCQFQCKHCNIHLSGNYERFAINLQALYGQDILLTLKLRSQSEPKIYDYELKTLIQVYYEKCQNYFDRPRVEEKVRGIIKQYFHKGGSFTKGTITIV